MSDIQPGDVVVCVDVSTIVRVVARRNLRIASLGKHLRLGAIYRALFIGVDPVDGSSTIRLAGIRDLKLACRFRKIRPADEQFIREMRAIKPVREDA